MAEIRRPGEKKEQKQIAQAEASEPLPPELEKMVDDEEAEEDLFEDSWTRTYVSPSLHHRYLATGVLQSLVRRRMSFADHGL